MFSFVYDLNSLDVLVNFMFSPFSSFYIFPFGGLIFCFFSLYVERTYIGNLIE